MWLWSGLWESSNSFPLPHTSLLCRAVACVWKSNNTTTKRMFSCRTDVNFVLLDGELVTEPTFHCSWFAGGEADIHRCAVSGPNHTWWCLCTSKQAQWRFDNSAFVNWGCFDFWYWRVPIQEPETEALPWWSGTWHQSGVSACDVDP